MPKPFVTYFVPIPIPIPISMLERPTHQTTLIYNTRTNVEEAILSYYRLFTRNTRTFAHYDIK